MPTAAQERANFNSMKDQKQEPLLPPPHVQAQYMNMMGNENMPAGPPSNQAGPPNGFQKAKAYHNNPVEIRPRNEMLVLDMMKPRPPPGLTKANNQNTRSNSSIGNQRSQQPPQQ